MMDLDATMDLVVGTETALCSEETTTALVAVSWVLVRESVATR
jgi:hypothetical protein